MMMTLEKVLQHITLIETAGTLSRDVSHITFDSREVAPGSMYVALRGSTTNGHAYITNAEEAGAAIIVCEELPAQQNPDVTYIKVENSAATLGRIASNFYGNPSSKLKLIGITGTNGKTSVTTLIHQLLKQLGHPSALFSTVAYHIGDKIVPSTHTTPDILRLNAMLAEALEQGCDFAVMEVSSHGLDQYRTAGLNFQVAGFTNITHDHLDYHGTFANYLSAKKSFFDQLSSEAVAIVNADDRNGKVMLQNTKATRKTFALKTMADYHGRVLETDFNGMLLNFNGNEFWTTLTGKFNAYNLLLAYAAVLECGFESAEVLQAVSLLQRVPGRFETLKSDGGIFFIVDYAHTPDALENILDSVNEIRTRNERLITVFGCGGDRDVTKRPEMGKIATQKSTLAIITSDNPRTEDPQEIIRSIESGVEPQHFSKFMVMPDRREAIKMAIKFAEPKDIIVIGGKGHETYQEINGQRHHFDDRETALELARLMSK